MRGGGDLTPAMRADMRVAATYATEASREIVQWAHLAAGTSAIREGSRLERAFRDMYTGTQHVFIGEKTYTDAAQIRLGTDRRPARAVSRQPQSCRDFTSRYSSRPKAPNSRPLPDCL